MEPPEGPSVDALGRQKERDAAQWTGPTTALGRSSIWYDPEAEEETVVPEGGAKKKKKKKKESAPREGGGCGRGARRLHLQARSSFKCNVSRSCSRLLARRRPGICQWRARWSRHRLRWIVLAVPTEPEPATMGPTVPLEPVPETEDAGGEAKKKKRKRRKKKASQACAGDVVMVEEDPAEGAGGVGDIDLGAGRCWWCGNHRCGKALVRWTQKKRKKKKRSSVVVPQVDSKADPVVVSQVGVPFGSKEAEEEEERSSQNSSCGGAFRRRGGAGAGRWCRGCRRWCRGCRRWCRLPPLLFRLLHLWEVAPTTAAAPMVAAPTVATQAVAPVAVAPMVVAASQGLKAEAVSKSSGSCSCIRSFAAAAVAATASRACGSVCPTCCRSSSRSTAFWSQSLGIKPGAEALGSASWDTKESSSQKGARAFSVNLMLGYPRVSVFARKKVFCAASWASFCGKGVVSVGRVPSAVRKG